MISHKPTPTEEDMRLGFGRHSYMRFARLLEALEHMRWYQKMRRELVFTTLILGASVLVIAYSGGNVPSLIIGAIAASTVFATAYQWHSNRAPEMILIEEIDKYERGLFFRRMKSEKMDESTYETISSAMEFVTLRCNDSKDGGVEEAKIVLEATFSDRQNPEGIVKYVFGKWRNQDLKEGVLAFMEKIEGNNTPLFNNAEKHRKVKEMIRENS